MTADLIGDSLKLILGIYCCFVSKMRQRFFLLLSSSALISLFTFIYQTHWDWIWTRRDRTRPHPNHPLHAPPPLNQIENLPPIYFEKTFFMATFNKTCGYFPQLHQVTFTNDHWQTQKTSNGTLYLLGAYLDDRMSEWVVRIVGTFDQIHPNQSFYCQIWLGQKQPPVIVATRKFSKIFLDKWVRYEDVMGLFHPYVISCPLPQNRVPISVSLVEFPCDNSTTSLRVDHAGKGPKKNFFVCVKGLSYPYEDKSIRLVEWIELLFVLGADKIVFYTFKNHPQIEKVLDYYSSQKKIEVIPLTLVGGASNSPFLQQKFLNDQQISRRLQEVLPYNDCFYRNFQKYRYVALLDIDEVIVPTDGQRWINLLDKLRHSHPGTTSYMARNAYFLDRNKTQRWFKRIPRYMQLLRHIWRTRNFSKTGYYAKGFHDTRQVVTLHNHFPIHCLQGPCRVVNFNVSDGYLHHYRNGCPEDLESCENMKSDVVIDAQLWNFADELVPKVRKIVRVLKLSKCEKYFPNKCRK